MCSIVASFDKEKLKELYVSNSYRGQLSYSLCRFFPNEKQKRVELGALYQDEGIMPMGLIEMAHSTEESFFVAHSQAPTTDTKNIHPAAYGNAMLWHNGIIKQKSISEGTWDTLWLLEQITNYGWSSLSRIDGTFACVMYIDSKLYAFRNEISPLFIDINLNISSTKFPRSESLKPNIVFEINIVDKKFDPVAYFTTHENPYYIPE